MQAVKLVNGNILLLNANAVDGAVWTRFDTDDTADKFLDYKNVSVVLRNNQIKWIDR